MAAPADLGPPGRLDEVLKSALQGGGDREQHANPRIIDLAALNPLKRS